MPAAIAVATNSLPGPVASVGESDCVVTVEMPAPPERVFQALASRDVVDWWVRPGVFDTREWTGEVRVGGRWRSSGLFRGEPYAAEGEFLEVDVPRRLEHTWRGVGARGVPTKVAYSLEKIGARTRLTLRHSGFPSREASANFAAGWETSLVRLSELLRIDAPGATAEPTVRLGGPPR